VDRTGHFNQRMPIDRRFQNAQNTQHPGGDFVALIDTAAGQRPFLPGPHSSHPLNELPDRKIGQLIGSDDEVETKHPQQLDRGARRVGGGKIFGVFGWDSGRKLTAQTDRKDRSLVLIRHKITTSTADQRQWRKKQTTAKNIIAAASPNARLRSGRSKRIPIWIHEVESRGSQT
jgi:hypothetical protein